MTNLNKSKALPFDVADVLRSINSLKHDMDESNITIKYNAKWEFHSKGMVIAYRIATNQFYKRLGKYCVTKKNMKKAEKIMRKRILIKRFPSLSETKEVAKRLKLDLESLWYMKTWIEMVYTKEHSCAHPE